MGFSGFNSGANAVCYKKENRNYGMICAWAMLVDYDRAMMLLGGQSDTGNSIKKGDIIGVSGLSEGQKDIVLKLGEGHSSKEDKLSGIKYHVEDTAIIIDGAKTTMVAQVIEVYHLEECKEDNLVYLKLLKTNEDEEKKFFSREML